MTSEPRAPRDPRLGARSIAASVLARVESDRAFAAPVLDAQIEAHPQLDPREVRLATELTYGVLRTKGALLAALEAHSRRGVGLGDPEAMAHLLVAAYTLLFLERVPAFAAVSEAVDAIGENPRVGKQGAGYANAVLRAIARDVEAGKRPDLGNAIFQAAPGWLRGSLRRSLGRQAAQAFLAAGPFPPPSGIAVNDPASRDRWLERLIEAAPGAELRASTLSPRGILALGAGHPRRLPGHEVDWIGQEEGAQLVSQLAAVRPGERVLDACAGRGNKAWTLAFDVGASGSVAAADLYPAKLSALAARLAGRSSGAAAIETFAVDWTVGPGDVPAAFDVVLCDAPCSGTGTLRRRPEIALHRTPEDVTELAELQLAIARRTAGRVRVGGRFVYAVCSVLREECEEVVERLLASDDGLTLEPLPFTDPLAEGASSLRLLPHVHGTDGYFVASFRVTAPR